MGVCLIVEDVYPRLFGNMVIPIPAEHGSKTAVMLATEGGHKDCLQLLIAAGANIDHQDKACDCSCAYLLMGVRMNE